MKIKKYNWLIKLLTPKNIQGITLAPFGIYLRQDIYDAYIWGSTYVVSSINLNYNLLYNVSVLKVRHEKIHWAQQMEMLIIFFYVWYFIEWVVKRSYRKISFEREAYYHEKDVLKNTFRYHFRWFKYIRTKDEKIK